jgi:hypothetical protein
MLSPIILRYVLFFTQNAMAWPRAHYFGLVVLGVFTAVLNGAHADSWGVIAVEQAIKIAVTSWPIFFAAVVAQSLKALATYRVERGIRLRVSTGSWIMPTGADRSGCLDS